MKRTLEPEIMDDALDAREYGTIDHAAADREFARTLAVELGLRRGELADLGAGPCGIPVEICRRVKGVKVSAVELSPAMLRLAAANIARSGFSRRIRLVAADAKATGLPARAFDFVVCNNLVHHIADPVLLLREAARLLRPGGGLLIRDLLRPRTAAELAARMRDCRGDTPRQRQLLRNSMRAALRPEEIEACARKAGLDGAVLSLAGERHWELRRPAAARRRQPPPEV